MTRQVFSHDVNSRRLRTVGVVKIARQIARSSQAHVAWCEELDFVVTVVSVFEDERVESFRRLVADQKPFVEHSRVVGIDDWIYGFFRRAESRQFPLDGRGKHDHEDASEGNEGIEDANDRVHGKLLSCLLQQGLNRDRLARCNSIDCSANGTDDHDRYEIVRDKRSMECNIEGEDRHK